MLHYIAEEGVFQQGWTNGILMKKKVISKKDY
jgi:hypothetical protein